MYITVVKTTQEEMISAKVPPEFRDYCIDEYMVFKACYKLKFPLVYRCKHERHALHDCEAEE